MLSLRQFEQEGAQILTTTEQRMIGMYVNELLVKLTPMQVTSRSLFNLYKECITELSQFVSSDSAEKTLRVFELGVLDLTGNSLQLSHDHVTMKPIETDLMYHYDIDNGATQAVASRTHQPRYTGRTLIAMREALIEYDSNILHEAKHLLRQVIDYHLGGKSIQTRDLFVYLSKLV